MINDHRISRRIVCRHTKLAIICAISIAVTLSGCSAESRASSTKATISAKAEASTSESLNNTEDVYSRAFLEAVHEGIPSTEDLSDELTIRLGKSVCQSFDDADDEGDAWLGLVKELMDGGFTANQSGQFIGASTAAFCPDYNNAYKQVTQ